MCMGTTQSWAAHAAWGRLRAHAGRASTHTYGAAGFVTPGIGLKEQKSPKRRVGQLTEPALNMERD